MKRLRHQLPFLRSLLKEANRFKGQDLLQHANADQVNAVSELVLNLLKNSIPVIPPIMAQLRPYKKGATRPGSSSTFGEKTSSVVGLAKRERVVSRTPERVMSMCSTTINLPTWVSLLQDANRERDEWKDECHYWKHKYHMLYREYMHILKSFLCERCRHLEDGELCPECSNKPPWKRCT